MRQLAFIALFLIGTALSGQTDPPAGSKSQQPPVQNPEKQSPGKPKQTQEPKRQEPEKPKPDQHPARPQTREEAALPALRALVKGIDDKRKELETARKNLPFDSSQRTTALKAIEELVGQLRKLETDFDSIITGIDRSQLELATRNTSINDDLEELLRPILQELKSATEEPRELERLRSQVSQSERKEEVATKAIENIQALQKVAVEEPVKSELALAATQWRSIRSDAFSSRTVAQAQLDQRMRDRKSLVESASALVGGFFRSKGLNLLLAALAMVLVFLGLRFTTTRALRIVRRPGKGNAQPFYFRLVSVLGQAIIIAVAVVAGLMVLYAAGDWVLLGLGLLFIVGVAWAAKNTLPSLLEEVRLVLNLGPVREGERIVFEGLPWRVERLSLYSRLTNPALSGGSIRLPLRDLVGLYSRPCQDKEAWFPCSEGDWVLLSDGTRAKVLRQTPEMVQLVKLGGSRITYQTAAFLGENPDNISANFRISVTFGVDYAHQAICTTTIPELMRLRVKQAIEDKIGEDKLINLAVEFKEAGASSLDYEVIIDLDGDVAARYDALKRLAQRTLVDACNEHGWIIPFTQITLHQATS